MHLRILAFALTLALPALADFRPLDTRCSAGQPGCFAELEKTTAPCSAVLRRRASTVRDDTAAEWRRCPVSGFRTVHDVDYVVVTDPKGGVWAFTNYVDPTQAVVKDFRFIGKKLFLLETASTRDVSHRWCFLDLTAESPECMSPPLPQLEEQIEAVLKPGESIAGDDWALTDVGAKKVTATRPIFQGGKQVGAINAVFEVSGGVLRIGRVQRAR